MLNMIVCASKMLNLFLLDNLNCIVNHRQSKFIVQSSSESVASTRRSITYVVKWTTNPLNGSEF